MGAGFSHDLLQQAGDLKFIQFQRLYYTKMKPFVVSSLATDKDYHSKESQHSQVFDSSFGGHPPMSSSSTNCTFCANKQLIISQLKLLEQAVLEKNRKIQQLEEFIHRLSQMVLLESADSELSDSHVRKNQEQTHSSAGRTESHPFQLSDHSKHSLLGGKIVLDENSQPSSCQFSQINSEITVLEAEEMKCSIRQSIEKADFGKEKKWEPSGLRKKLVDMMNVLPSKGTGLQEFQSLSEPLSEGTAGQINVKGGVTSKTPRFQKRGMSECNSSCQSEVKG